MSLREKAVPREAEKEKDWASESDCCVTCLSRRTNCPHEKWTQRVVLQVVNASCCNLDKDYKCYSLSLFSLKMRDSRWAFSVDVPLKQTRKGKHDGILAFPQITKLCVVPVLKYIRRSKDVGGRECKLLLSHQKSHKHVSKDILARWLRDVLNKAGVTRSSLVHTVPLQQRSPVVHRWISSFQLQGGAQNLHSHVSTR